MTYVPLADWYPGIVSRWENSDRHYHISLSERIGFTWHHTAGGAGSVPLAYARWVADWHFDRWSRPGGYNFLIGTDAVAREMCGFGHVGAHAPGGNRSTIGIGFQGTYGDRLPSPAMLATAVRLMAYEDIPTRQFGHRDWSDTACPGDALYAAIPVSDEGGDMALSDDDVERIRDAVAGITVPDVSERGGSMSLVNAIRWAVRHARGANRKVAELDVPDLDIDELADRVVAASDPVDAAELVGEILGEAGARLQG